MNARDPVYKCFSYDSLMTVINAIMFTIHKGGDIENGAVLNKAMRQQRFAGCSGTVSIASESNDRSQVLIEMNNGFYNITSKSWSDIPVGTYNIASTQPFVFFRDIIWPTSSRSPPSDLRIENNDCPFDPEDVRGSFKGTMILYIVSIIIAAITLLITYFIWKRW